MSIGSLGIIGSLASTPLAQKGPEADKVQREALDRARQVESESQAEMAAGIGQTEEESQASERDADGRRPWERNGRQPTAPADATAESANVAAPAALPKDPTGNCGSLLDVQG